VELPLYAVRRGGAGARGNVLERHPDLFVPVVDMGSIGLVRVDTEACRAAAADPDLPGISQEELLRESKL